MSKGWPYGVRHDHTIPVYAQIENHVRFAIASGYLKPGETLPSVRKLAQELGVNSNTVTKSYRDLELVGLLETRRGVGIKVAAGADQLCCDATRMMALDHLAEAVAESLAAGVAGTQIRKTVQSALQANTLPYRGGDHRQTTTRE